MDKQVTFKDHFIDITEILVDPAMREDQSREPVHVVVKFNKYHKPIINPVRHQLGVPVWASENSGFRPLYWETVRGRSPMLSDTRDDWSRHTFGQALVGSEQLWDQDNWGAIDWTTKNNRIEDLLELLIESEYQRVAYYPHNNFVHCDFKGSRKVYAEAQESGKWKFKEGVR